MLILLTFMYFQTSLHVIQGTILVNKMAANSSMQCRTERQVYLIYDQFKSDACARCYKYMPLSIFRLKFHYDSRHGVLRDPRTNRSHSADPFDASQELLNSFLEVSLADKWKACCVAAWECCIDMMKDPPLPNDSLQCPRTWDGWQCWKDTPAGTTATQSCQDHIYFETSPPSCTKYAYKQCWPNGTWYMKENSREWTNYKTCGRSDEHRRFLNFHIATYVTSIIFIIPALIIFMTYKQLQVPRITMHKNLFLSLLLNGIVVVLFKTIFIAHELNRSTYYGSILDKSGPGCKILLTLTKYFRMTNYMWMFCEGFYLHKLISAAFAEQRNLLVFYLIGWVLPLVPVSIYAILRGTFEDEKCWTFPIERYEWIINVPNLLSLLVNLFFLFHIISVLITKLRATHANEPSQYRKAVRATLVLVPLFGLHFCLVIYRPQSGRCGLLEAYVYFHYAMDGLQGLMVALIFCYVNSEVIYLLKRSYQRYKLHHQIRGATHNGAMLRRMSATQDSTVNDSQNNHHGHHRTKVKLKETVAYAARIDATNAYSV